MLPDYFNNQCLVIKTIIINRSAAESLKAWTRFNVSTQKLGILKETVFNGQPVHRFISLLFIKMMKWTVFYILS